MQKQGQRIINVAKEDSRIEKGVKWRSRGYLPHFDGGSIPQCITFRVSDSLPIVRLKEWEAELVGLPFQQFENERRRKIEEYLDKGAGERWLSRPCIAELVEQALLCFDSQRYFLHSWVVMPNHVHVLITPQSGNDLWQILHSWKSFTAKKANKLLGRAGEFWQPKYFDRFIRHQEHFEDAVKYIEFNPVKAALCELPESWPFSSAAWRSSF
jgi:REP element-mobilizing transposase RayT